MSSNDEIRRMQRKKPEQESDCLSSRYRKIGIKAVAAAASKKAEGTGDASGDEEQRKRTREKADG